MVGWDDNNLCRSRRRKRQQPCCCRSGSRCVSPQSLLKGFGLGAVCLRVPHLPLLVRPLLRGDSITELKVAHYSEKSIGSLAPHPALRATLSLRERAGVSRKQ